MTDKIVTRYAPSPTGFQHIGGMRTALFAWLWARKNNGTFILRIEDTDLERKVEGAIEHTKEALSWLGFKWDYGPDKPGPFGSCIQSERLPIYREFAQKLIDRGLAYPDPYTLEELAAFRKQAETERRPFLYRYHRPATFETWDGTKPLRFKIADPKRYSWHDDVRGKLEAGEEALDDFILIKSDGYPTYNFAHIVDDHLMGVTHVFRADEFIASTPRFLSLYDALEIPYPHFVTLPPILREDRTKKLGKRDGAKDILDYRTDGYLPEAMINFLALIGWNPGTEQEVFTREELIAAFLTERIHIAGAALNEEKLDWLNREHLRRISDDALMEIVKGRLPTDLGATLSEERLLKLLPLIRERITVLSDIEREFTDGEFTFAVTEPTPSAAMLAWKKDTSPKDALLRLERVVALLQSIAEDSSADTIKEVLFPYAEEVGKGEVLWPLRVAVTGKERSPDPFTVIGIIGVSKAISRVKKACDTIKSA